jgi:hypothetical protein
VLPVGWRCVVAVEWDSGAGEIEGAAVDGGDDFYSVGVGDIFRSTTNFERGYVDVCLRERAYKGDDVFGSEQRFVTLNIDVDIGVVELRDGVKAVGSAGEIGRGEFDRDVETMAEGGDFFGVGSDEDLVELGAGLGRLDDPGEERLAGDFAEELTGKAGGGEAGRNDAEDAVGIRHEVDRLRRER